MNSRSFHYKALFTIFALILGYAYMHVRLTGIYVDVGFDKLDELSMRLPFAQRLLLPYIAAAIHFFIPIDSSLLYFVMECLFLIGLYAVLYQLLTKEFDANQAQLLTGLFFLILPLVTVINYRLDLGGSVPIFCIYDTPSMFFTALGFWLCLEKKWGYFSLCIFFATLNRESSLLIILLAFLLYYQTIKEVIKPLFISFLVFILAKLIVCYLVRELPGTWLEWMHVGSGRTHFDLNLYWLFAQGNIFLFLYCFAGLPLFWFTFYDYIPLRYRPIGYLVFFYFLGLMLVGNLFEARIFSEIIVLLYLPVLTGITYWLKGAPVIWPEKTYGFLYFFDRYAILFFMLLIIIFNRLINKNLLEWLGA